VDGPVVIGIGVGAGVLMVVVLIVVLLMMRRKKKEPSSSSFAEHTETSVVGQPLVGHETFEEWETMPTMYATEVVDDGVFRAERE
jgi:hypothetical protein